MRDLALNIATTDSFGSGGNPWKFVADDFIAAVSGSESDEDRQAALDLLSDWDGHFVSGGPAFWAGGMDRADAWVLMDAWIRKVINMTFADELAVDDGSGNMVLKESNQVLFNVLLHPLPRRKEIAVEVDSDPRAVFWLQVRNGMWIRAALMLLIFDRIIEIDEYYDDLTG